MSELVEKYLMLVAEAQYIADIEKLVVDCYQLFKANTFHEHYNSVGDLKIGWDCALAKMYETLESHLVIRNKDPNTYNLWRNGDSYRINGVVKQ